MHVSALTLLRRGFFAKICRLRGFYYVCDAKVDQFGVSRIKFTKLWHREGGERSQFANRFRDYTRATRELAGLLVVVRLNQCPDEAKKGVVLRKTQSEIT
jgi:hypothetical protein